MQILAVRYLYLLFWQSFSLPYNHLMNYQNKIICLSDGQFKTLTGKMFTEAPLVCMPLIIFLFFLLLDHIFWFWFYLFIYLFWGVGFGTLFACLHYGDFCPIWEQKPDPYEPSLVKPYHPYLRSTFPVESSSLLERRVCECVCVD